MRHFSNGGIHLGCVSLRVSGASLFDFLEPPELPLKSGELCGKTRHTFFGSARLVSGPYSVCTADSTALKVMRVVLGKTVPVKFTQIVLYTQLYNLSDYPSRESAVLWNFKSSSVDSAVFGSRTHAESASLVFTPTQPAAAAAADGGHVRLQRSRIARSWSPQGHPKVAEPC